MSLIARQAIIYPDYPIIGYDTLFRDEEPLADSSNTKVLNKTTPDELKSIVADASIVIGNDTGPTHMAWALNVPSITLFGSTPARNTYITSINRAIESSSAVNPYKLNKNDFSISEIEPSQIVKIAKEIHEQQAKISSL